MGMDDKSHPNSSLNRHRFSARNLVFLAFCTLPIPLVNFTLRKLIHVISHRRPEIFRRIEGHHHKTFLIDATNIPFLICLRPNPDNPQLTAVRRRNVPESSARISGSFLTLLGMIDGRYDGDALFFTRDLCVEGDTEAVVCLRNALDDVEGSIADDVAAFFGMPGRKFLEMAREMKIHV